MFLDQLATDAFKGRECNSTKLSSVQALGNRPQLVTWFASHIPSAALGLGADHWSRFLWHRSNVNNHCGNSPLCFLLVRHTDLHSNSKTLSFHEAQCVTFLNNGHCRSNDLMLQILLEQGCTLDPNIPDIYVWREENTQAHRDATWYLRQSSAEVSQIKNHQGLQSTTRR